jgi:hypothetical protein
MTTDAVTPLRHRMIEDMNARKLCAGTQRGHIHSCKRFAMFLNRSPDTATTEDIRRFQLHLAEAGVSICNHRRRFCGQIGWRAWGESASPASSEPGQGSTEGASRGQEAAARSTLPDRMSETKAWSFSIEQRVAALGLSRRPPAE